MESRSLPVRTGFCLLAALALFAGAPAHAEVFKGTGKGERVKGSNDGDRLSGKGGDDQILGRGGNDKLKGGPGDDRLDGGKGVDKLTGSSGADTLKAVDGEVDRRVSGGGGKDVCKVDAVDRPRMRGCETIKVRGGGGGSGGGGDGGSGGGGGPGGDAPLTVIGATGLTGCGSPLPASCQFAITGTGADAATGTVTPSAPTVLGTGEVRGGSGGAWTADGRYGCTANGTLTVRIGDESTAVNVVCGVGGGAGNGPLVATAGSSSCTPTPLPLKTCTFTLSGTGADLPAGTATIQGGTGGGTATANPTTGAWSASGGYNCSAPPTVTVTIGTESTAPIPLAC